MNIEEATLILKARQGTSDLVSRTGGWPAVIGLAALTEPRSAPADQLPSALHEFLAEELFHDVGEVTRDGLVQLSLSTSVTEPLARFLLGARAGEVLRLQSSAVSSFCPDRVMSSILSSKPFSKGSFENATRSPWTASSGLSGGT